MVGIHSVADYSPFGVELDGRTQFGAGYRYSFQGQEKDDEVKGEGNSINYKYRMHDPRVGRFFAVDPLIKDYPWYTSYSFSGNKLVAWRELEGLEEAAVIRFYDPDDVFVAFYVIKIPENLRVQPSGVLIVNRTTSSSPAAITKPDPLSLFNMTTDPNGVTTNTGIAGGVIVTASPNKKEQDIVDHLNSGNPRPVKQKKFFGPRVIEISTADQIVPPSDELINIFKTSLEENPQYAVEVTGHASNSDNVSESYNVQLSQKRADNAADMLINRGIPENQIDNQGGKGSSIQRQGFDNSDERNRKKQRRVELRLTVPKDNRYN